MIQTDIIIIFCLIFSAFFSGMEIAYISANRIFLEIEKDKQNLVSKMLKIITKSPSKFISSMLVGNNISLVAYGIFMGERIIDILFPLLDLNEDPLKILLFQTLISTFIILITAEFLPKVFFQLYSNTLIRFFAIPATFFYYIFSPITFIIINLSDLVLKLFFGVKNEKIKLTFSKGELGDYIEEQVESIVDKEHLDSEIQIFKNALVFSKVKAREVMVPRAELITIEKSSKIIQLRELFSSTGLSKIPVYNKNIDDIIGYVHAFEMLKKPNSITKILLPIEWVPETMPINEVLNRLTVKRKSLAVVLDEYGGTSGILTVEDIVEELFGEIEDEHDLKDHFELKVNEKRYEFSARLEVNYINQTYNIGLPEDENYETLGGLVVHNTEEIPKKNDIINLQNFKFKIIDVSSTKIEKIRVEIIG
ncbi:MAG: hemolysin family protein [Flavobacteriaceae bacterium]|nr:hemolysin family protein [Flavobacteriaceae bacterium]